MFVLNQNVMGGGNITTLNAFNKRTPCNTVPLVGTLASAVVGGAMEDMANDKANQQNQQLAKDQNQWNLSMWNRQNEYNSPAAQRERMEAAGMNPFFNEVSAGTASSVPQAAVPTMRPSDNLGRSVASASQSYFENEMNQQLIHANVRKATAEASSAESQAILNKYEANRILGSTPYDIEQSKQLSLHTAQSTELLKLQAENQDIENSLKAAYGDKFAISSLQNMEREGLKIISDRNVNEADIGKIASEIAKNYAEANNLQADTKTIDAIRTYVKNSYILNNTKTGYENNLLKVNSDWQQKHGADALDQQLDAAKFENGSYSRYVKPFIPAASAIGGALLLKGKKGSPQKVGTRTETDVYSNDKLVKSILRKSRDEYE